MHHRYIENVWFQGSVIGTITVPGRIAISRVLRGRRRSDAEQKVRNFRMLPETSCHLSTPRERSIFTIL